jgi:4-hydroxy-3-methylbut-2-enyl diphosphate reductase
MAGPPPESHAFSLFFALKLCNTKFFVFDSLWITEHQPEREAQHMIVIRAEAMGLCFGVRDALALAEGVADPGRVTIHGELVHNSEILGRLASAGFHQTGEADRDGVPASPLVMITAHGVSEVERRRLEGAGKQLIDATCPLVRRVHDAAQELRAEGRKVLLVGKPGHVEVRGVIEDLDDCEVIAGADEVRSYGCERLGLLSQSTMPPSLVDAVWDRVVRLNPEADLRRIDTVCLPTRQRRQAVLDLLDRVEAMVVVGGKHSNNTRHLVELCEQRGRLSLHVESADELDPAWFAPFTTVGLTAGTSTPDAVIVAVHQALLGMEPERVDRLRPAAQPASVSGRRRPGRPPGWDQNGQSPRTPPVAGGPGSRRRSR